VTSRPHPCGIDQDPHFRVARDVARSSAIRNLPDPQKLLPSLLDRPGKCLPPFGVQYLHDDTEAQAQKKVMNASPADARRSRSSVGSGNPYICSIFAQYNYIFEPDDGHLAEVERTCKSGERLLRGLQDRALGQGPTVAKRPSRSAREAKDRLEQFVVRD